MPVGRPIDRDRVLDLLKEGRSHEEIAEELGVSASAIANAKTRLRKEGLLEGVPSAPKSTPKSVPKSDKSTPAGVPKSEESTPSVVPGAYFGTPADVDDLKELLAWWRKRLAGMGVLKADSGTPEEYERRTFIIRRELVDRIRQYADAEGITVKAAFNRIVLEGLSNLEGGR